MNKKPAIKFKKSKLFNFFGLRSKNTLPNRFINLCIFLLKSLLLFESGIFLLFLFEIKLYTKYRTDFSAYRLATIPAST